MKIGFSPAAGLVTTHSDLTTGIHGVTGVISEVEKEETLKNKTLEADGITLKGDLLPDEDNTRDLGSATKNLALTYTRVLIIKNLGEGSDPNIQSNSDSQTAKLTGNWDLLTGFLTGTPGAGDPPEFKSLNAEGLQNVPFMGVSNGGLGLADGIAAPESNETGVALIYVDSADGDLKIRFSDGTVKTIVVDT